MKKKVLVFGGSGLVGSNFIQTLGSVFEINKFVSYEIKSPSSKEVDILNKDQITKIAQQFEPDTVINFAAYTQVEEAENQKGLKDGQCFTINVVGAKNIADVCKSLNLHLIQISTEYVFDGTKSDSPYKEDDQPNPINWYGQTKYFGEQFVLESGCPVTIVRISMPFSPTNQPKKDIARFFLEQLKNGSEIAAVEDQKITPTLVSDIARALEVLINEDKQGIYHVCSKDYTTPFEFAKAIALKFNLDARLIKPISFDEYNKGKLAKLLKNSWLSPDKFEREFGAGILHTIEESVGIFKSLSEQVVDGKSSN